MTFWAPNSLPACDAAASARGQSACTHRNTAQWQVCTCRSQRASTQARYPDTFLCTLALAAHRKQDLSYLQRPAYDEALTQALKQAQRLCSTADIEKATGNVKVRWNIRALIWDVPHKHRRRCRHGQRCTCYCGSRCIKVLTLVRQLRWCLLTDDTKLNGTDSCSAPASLQLEYSSQAQFQQIAGQLGLLNEFRVRS